MDTITKSQVCEIMKQVDNDAVASYNLRIGNYNNHCFVTMESGREYVLRIYIPIVPENQEQQIAREVDVTVRNLPPGQYHYEKYLIDRNHSNSYAVRERFFSDIARMRAQCLEEAKGIMAQQGCAEENIKFFSERADELTVYSEYSRYSRKARERLDSMSQSVREDIEKMMVMYAGLYNHEVIEIASEVNEWQEVKLQKIEERKIEIKESSVEYRAQLALEPYSVCLITLTEHRSETK
jgi:hypothetical protein